MHTAANELPPQQGPSTPPDWPAHTQIEAREPRNLILLATHQIVLRVGWIFKTESVIMPAFIDLVAGPGAGPLRGCLPALNRLGQSVPPVFCAERLKASRYKKRALATFTLLMSLPFATLSLVWFGIAGQKQLWVAALFLVLYFIFFVFNGLYQVSFGTIQGKLIRPTRRGRLLLVSTALGTIPAMLFAWWLLKDWLKMRDSGFGYIFAFTGVCFFLSGLTALLLFEPADDPPRQKTQKTRAGGTLSEAWHALRGNLSDTGCVLRRDGNLRRLVLVAMLFGSGLIVFPHYQALARDELNLSGVHLMVWVITQNAAVGSYSLLVGPLADAWGNRLTLRTLIFGAAIAPLFAVFLSQTGSQTGGKLFWLVFIPLGVTPLVLRILINYTLEICEPAEHPRYLSTVNLCLAAPFVLSPAVGCLVEVVGYPAVFLSAAGLIALSGCLTFRLDEPRHRVPSDEITAIGPGGEE